MAKPQGSPEARALGAEIRRRRHSVGWTLEDLSDRSGLATNYLSPIENGKRDPGLSTILKLARAFDVEAGDLLGAQDLDPEAVDAARLFSALSEEGRAEIIRLMRLLPQK